MLKCMLENDVFVNVKPNKINKEYKEIKKSRKILGKSLPNFYAFLALLRPITGFLMKKWYTVWK